MLDPASFLVSHPTGNSFVRALLIELEKENKLSHFFTTIGFGTGCNPFFSKIKKRRGYEIPDHKILRQWIPEIARLLAKGNQVRKRSLTDRIYEKLDIKVSKAINTKVKIIHAYEDGAYATFSRAKQLGIYCTYELPIAYWATNRRLLSEEAERYPHWKLTLESNHEPEEKLFRKDEELKLADQIFCPSKFVLESIPKEIRNKTSCTISPFGSPSYKILNSSIKRIQDDHLKVLFVGSMSQRKGLADLFEAMKLLKRDRVRLSILGQLSMPMEFYLKQLPHFTYYPPCNNNRVREIMREHDILVLPSIAEGRALVQQEALSCGLPLITTPNAGGEDLIDEGHTGYLIPIRSPEKIAEKITLHRDHRISRHEIHKCCQKKASEYTWTAYAQKIINSSQT